MFGVPPHMLMDTESDQLGTGIEQRESDSWCSPCVRG